MKKSLENGIMKFPESWNKIDKQNSKYIVL